MTMTEEDLQRYNELIEKINELGLENWENKGVQVDYIDLVDAYNGLIESSFDKEAK